MPSKQVLESIAEMSIEALDQILPGLRKHSERVSALSVETGRRLGLSEDALETLRFAARLHDIGILINFHDTGFQSQEAHFDTKKVTNLFNPTAMTIVAATHQSWMEQAKDCLNRRSMISLSASIVSAAELYDNARKGLRPFPRVVPRHNLECAMLGLVGTCFDPRIVPVILRVARKMRAYCEEEKSKRSFIPELGKRNSPPPIAAG